MSELALGQIKGLSVNSNVVTVPSGHTLYAPGHVIQVVSTPLTTTFGGSLAQGSFATITGLTATITPKFSTSKILILASVNCATAISTIPANLRLKRDATPIGIGDSSGSRQRVTAVGAPPGNYADVISINYLDNPATTSSITYSIDISHGYAGTTGAYVNFSNNDTDASWAGRGISSITVLEIAA